MLCYFGWLIYFLIFKNQGNHDDVLFTWNDYITCANIISFSVVLQLFFFIYKKCSILHATSMSNNVWCLLSKTPLGHLSFTNLILDFCNFSIYNCIEHHAAHLFHDPTKVVKQKDKCNVFEVWGLHWLLFPLDPSSRYTSNTNLIYLIVYAGWIITCLSWGK